MANKPVKVLSDLLTRRQIIKQDLAGNTIFLVSGSIDSGYVSSSNPITASYFVGDGRYLTNISSSGALTVVTSGSISGSGLVANPIFLKDPLVIGTITSSYIYSPQITGSLYGTASFAETAGNVNTTAIQNAYKRLRYTEVGFFDVDGSKIVELPTSSLGGTAFVSNSFDHINVTVFIKEDNRWLNELLSVQLYTSSNVVYVELSAPALDNTNEYKLIAVNEDPSYYII